MKEFPDDELDKLFRKSAEELDSDFDPQDWNKLKKRLDENDGRTAAGWWRKWWPLGLLTLLFVGGITAYITLRHPEEPVLVSTDFSGSNSQRNDKSTEIQTVEKPQPDDSVSAEVKEQEEISVKNEDAPNSQIVKNQKILPRRSTKTGGVYLAPNRSIGRRRGSDGANFSEKIAENEIERKKNVEKELVRSDQTVEELSAFGSKQEESKRKVAVENEMELVPGADDVQKVNLDGSEERVAGNANDRFIFSAKMLARRTGYWHQEVGQPEIKGMEPIVTAESQTSEKADGKSFPGFAVRFGFSPDMSAVGIKNFVKPGTAVSLLIEYAFMHRLYVQTGLIRSRKVYNAKAGEYAWPENWNDQKTLPVSTDAECKVIEIPMNLRYDLFDGDRSRFFAGAGASSYYMQNEKYAYNYAKKSNKEKWQEYETSTGWYWLSHVNASVGFEYRFSKKISFLAEPYVRIPVKKVGFGKVDLFTAGMWLSIRYTPTFKTKK